MQLLNAPRTAAHGLAALGEQFADFLDAERLAVVAVDVEVEDVAYDQRFGGVDFEAFLLSSPAAADVGGDGFETEGRTGAAVEALPDVLAHGAVGVLGILPALVFVEEVDDAPHHFAAGVVAGRLSDGDDFDLVLTEFPFIDAEFDTVAEEPGQAVNHDGVERRRFLQGVGDHLLEDRAFVVGGGRTGFDVFPHDGVAVGVAPFDELPNLVGNGEVVVGLAGRRDTGIESDVHDSFSVVRAPLPPLGGMLAPAGSPSRSGVVRYAQP
ncbi:MAG: hypothetical protein QM701_11305 [Propionivibrio sp.]